MGSQMTKELGVYNEEEKVCTPLGPQRYRLLDCDPRSVTAGIARTPIQVTCTPPQLGLKTLQRSTSVPESEISAPDNNEDKEEEINFEQTKDNALATEDDSNLNEEINSVCLKQTVKYLETDIDSVDVVLTSTPAVTNVDKPVIALMDVRSPTLEIVRTPVLVHCTPELFALHACIDRMSFCDLDVHPDDPSAIVSEDEQSMQHNRSTVNQWLSDVKHAVADNTPHNTSFTDSPRQVAKKQRELNSLKKQLFFTPDDKVAGKPKVRTPLGNIQAGQLKESPQKLMRVKQWRNIQEERQRLGITDAENTPPSLPPLAMVSSAPGKMGEHKRSKMNWDEENTLFI